MGAYVLSVVSTGILCALVQILFEKGNPYHHLIRLICGIILTLSVLQPVLGDKISLLQGVSRNMPDFSIISEQGEAASKEAMGEIINSRITAYILDKAEELGAALTVELSLSDTNPPLPEAVTLIGAVSPYVKKQLTAYIRDELGICEENQRWIY